MGPDFCGALLAAANDPLVRPSYVAVRPCAGAVQGDLKARLDVLNVS
jgi:hypothetical protein